MYTSKRQLFPSRVAPWVILWIDTVVRAWEQPADGDCCCVPRSAQQTPATPPCCHCLRSLPLAPAVRIEFHPKFVLSQPCQVYCIWAGLFACSGFPESPFWKQHFNMPLTVFYLPGLRQGHPVATLHYKKQKKKKKVLF